ncbi:hypothetical protein IE53DRAFT_312878 [Violaceomyces palustris]|uniref:Uncharacterized protein n=1 Tax=Violaceomyces palustris TaxID=1673888 RepID=A0ACD0P1Q1_9BASI|nr:hypothetical protein IE53DRAFT_312878 [Violaceomyces palustris]
MVLTAGSEAGAEPGIIFEALPLDLAKSFLVLIIIYSIFFGMVVLDFVSNIRFDLRLIRKPGWTQLPKLLSRGGYLLCRLLSPTCLLLVLLYLVLPFDNCESVPRAFNILGMFLLDSVALIFVQRTMALYAWNPKVVVPLTVHYLIVVAASAISVPFYGLGVRIPNSNYCAYDTRRDLTRSMAANITYKATSMLLDIAVMLLTLHRLIEGGLTSILKARGKRVYYGKTTSSLSSFLIRQGFHFYVLQSATDIIFITMFWSFNEVSYQVIGSALIFSIPPIAAGAAFREMGRAASQISPRDGTRVNEIMNSSGASGSEGRVGGPGSEGKARSRKTSEGHMPSHSAAMGYGLGIASQGQNAMGREEKRDGASWSGRGGLGNQTTSRHGEGSGVIVTVGTVSRTDDADENWDVIESPRNSSDLRTGDHESVEIRRNWPKLSANGMGRLEKGIEKTEGSRDSFTSYNSELSPVNQRDDPLSSSSSPHGRQRYAGRSPVNATQHGPAIEPESPWLPTTPESPYPHTPRITFAQNDYSNLAYPAPSASSSGRSRIQSSEVDPRSFYFLPPANDPAPLPSASSSGDGINEVVDEQPRWGAM